MTSPTSSGYNPTGQYDSPSMPTQHQPYRSETAPPRRQGDETKSSFKTTELIAYVVAVIGVLIAARMVESDGAGADFFRAERAWLYITVLTVGYMISRGLAKSGSRHHSND